MKISALIALTCLHYFWVAIWINVPPALLVYAIYAPLYVLAVISCMGFDRSWLRLGFRGVLLLALAIVFTLVSIFGAELIYGRADRWSLQMLNAGVLIGLPFKFLGWLHLLASWLVLRMLSRRDESARIGTLDFTVVRCGYGFCTLRSTLPPWIQC